MSHLFCFGFGYSARALANVLTPRGWRITGTATTAEGVDGMRGEGHLGFLFDGKSPAAGAREALRNATHVLISVPPDASGDPVLAHHARDLAEAPDLSWIGYLSTIGVYGDRDGDWVEETDEPRPSSERSRLRLLAEQAWLEFAAQAGKRVQAFRLAGIYGPGRSAIDNLLKGTARPIIKPGQVFNRIHVDDIAAVLESAIRAEARHTIYNVADDEPAPPQDVIAFAAELIGVPPPPAIPIEAADLTPMAASFYRENKRVRNARIKQDLGVRLAYPTYRDGLRAIAALKG